MHLTRKKLELLKIIYEFRYMPTKSLVKISKHHGLYGHKQSLHYVLRQLECEGYLGSFAFGFGDAGKVVFITAKSAKVLAKFLGLPKSEVSHPSQGFKLKYPYLEHSMALVDIYLKLKDTFEVTKWLGDQQVFFTYRFQNFASGKMLNGNLSPDGFFEIFSGGQKYSFFLKYDTGTMDGFQLAKKFKRYFEYFVYGKWNEKFVNFPGIFFITEREREMMKKLIEKDMNIKETISGWERSELKKSRNIVYRGMGLCEEINNIDHKKLLGFLKQRFIFTFSYEKWEEDLLKSQQLFL